MMLPLATEVRTSPSYMPEAPAMAAGFTDHIWTVGELLNLPLVFEGGAAA